MGGRGRWGTERSGAQRRAAQRFEVVRRAPDRVQVQEAGQRWCVRLRRCSRNGASQESGQIAGAYDKEGMEAIRTEDQAAGSGEQGTGSGEQGTGSRCRCRCHSPVCVAVALSSKRDCRSI